MGLFGSPNVERLRQRGDLPGLVRALGHRDAAVRASAALALRVGDQVIANSLSSSRPKAVVRKHIKTQGRTALDPDVLIMLMILGDMLTGDAIDPLIASLEDGDARVREEAATTLGQARAVAGSFASPELMEDLAVTLDGGLVELIRHQAARKAGVGPRPAPLPRSRRSDGSQGDRSRSAAADFFRTVARKNAEILDALREVARDRDEAARTAAEDALDLIARADLL